MQEEAHDAGVPFIGVLIVETCIKQKMGTIVFIMLRKMSKAGSMRQTTNKPPTNHHCTGIHQAFCAAPHDALNMIVTNC